MPATDIVSSSDAAHLLRRVGFGPTAGEIAALTGLTRQAAVASVMDFVGAPAVVRPAVDNRSNEWQCYVNAQEWWVERMRTTNNPLQEKMTLFWHNHFCSGQDKLFDMGAMFDQNEKFRNYAGDTHIIADVMGWFPAASGFHSLTPLRILDTRVGTGVLGAVGARRTIDTDGLCRGNVPLNAKAIVMNVTAVAPTADGYITVWPSGEARPESSNLNFVPGQTVPNLVITKVGIEGMVSFYNEAGDTHLIADVMGWFD